MKSRVTLFRHRRNAVSFGHLAVLNLKVLFSHFLTPVCGAFCYFLNHRNSNKEHGVCESLFYVVSIVFDVEVGDIISFPECFGRFFIHINNNSQVLK